MDQETIKNIGWINPWLFDWDEAEVELWLIEDIDVLVEKEQEEFMGNRLITSNPDNDWEDNFFNEKYFEN